MTKKLLGIAVSLTFLFHVQDTFWQKRGASTLDERKRAVEIATLLKSAMGGCKASQ
jgi:hypothetical protein